MRFNLILLLVPFLISVARADFILSPGAGIATSGQSDEMSGGKPTLKNGGGFGILANMDWRIFSPLTIGVGLGYYSHSGETQYKNTEATANKLDTQMGQFNFEAGAKLRFINFKKFKIFVGGGFSAGNLALTFDEDDFEDTTGALTGFERSESKGYTGYYWDAGVEYIFSNTSGLRISLKEQHIKTKEFENLNNQQINLEFVNVNVQYMHYVNWDFFFK